MKKRREHDDDNPEQSGAEPTRDESATESAATDDALAKAAQERDEFKDRFARALADMDNLRKRTQRDLEDGRRYAVAEIARDLLEVQDNLQRALAGVPADARDSGLAAGVRLVEEQIAKLLATHGVQPVASVGQPFDPAVHQAIATESHPEFPPGTVTSELVRGYRIHDRLLRPAMVKVAAADAATPMGGVSDEG